MMLRPAATLAALTALAGFADAHSWYSQRSDPVYGTPCCGGSDCGQLVISGNVLTAEESGYRIRLSLAEAKRINPRSTAPIDAIVIWKRVQRSEDGNFHICLMGSYRDAVRGGIYCLFAPPNI